MSNIGNQVVAVVATLLGFIAHDYISESKPVTRTDANVIMAAADIDPVVTRSLDMDGLSLDAAARLTAAPAAMQKAPVPAVTDRTAAVKSDDSETAFAVMNDARSFRSIAPQEAGYLR